MTDIELFTSDELVAELMKRRTFLGIVIRAEEEVTGQVMPDYFQMACRNLTPDQVVSILTHLGESLREDIENGDGPEWQEES